MQSIAWTATASADARRDDEGFPGAAGPRKGADQTVAGLFRRAPQRIVLREPFLQQQINKTAMEL
jgi:hypothetical protein